MPISSSKHEVDYSRKPSYSNTLRLLKIIIPVFSVSCIGLPIAAYAAQDEPDSSKVYREIENFSNKSKFTRFLYGMLFKPVASTSLTNIYHKTLQMPYGNFEGKIIRHINIVTLDPFGYSINDTTVVPKKMVLEFGNKLHIKTQYFTIKNILLFREKDPFDLLLVKESERLIRSLYYVRDVVFHIAPVKDMIDSVDMYIRVVDKWSIIANGNVFSAHRKVCLIENNFIGFGHEFQNTFSWNRSTTDKNITSNYFIPNFRNSHINTTLHFNIDENDYFDESISVERPFYSPLAKWAAGLNVAQQFNKDTFADTLQGGVMQDFRCYTQDYWVGKANRIFKGTIENDFITNAILSMRYLRIRYSEKPNEQQDSLHIYSNEDFYLAGIGVSTRKYLRDKYIFNFGFIEDVPVGKAYGITGGYQIRNNTGRIYLGTHIFLGDYTKWGNLSCDFEYGTFFYGPLLQQGVFSANARYFSNLFEIGNWKIRQFIKPQVTIGINQFSFDTLTIDDENGIRGFSSSLRGTKKIVFTHQIQSYSPWKVLGFRFGPYLIYSLGMLGNAPSGFKNSPVYSQLGIGTLIKNDYLVFSNFQLSISYYPSIPGDGYNIFKFNTFTTTDFGFRDFVFGKPKIAAFQ